MQTATIAVANRRLLLLYKSSQDSSKSQGIGVSILLKIKTATKENMTPQIPSQVTTLETLREYFFRIFSSAMNIRANRNCEIIIKIFPKIGLD